MMRRSGSAIKPRAASLKSSESDHGNVFANDASWALVDGDASFASASDDNGKDSTAMLHAMAATRTRENERDDCEFSKPGTPEIQMK